MVLQSAGAQADDSSLAGTASKKTGADAENGLDTTATIGASSGQAPLFPILLAPPMGSPDADSAAAAAAAETMELSSLLMDLEAQMKVETGNEAYLEALDQAPAVVKAEADPAQFLRRDDMNVSAAARRMCNYWNLRKETFEERFTRSLLDLSGNGALPQSTIDMITSTGVAVVLPNDDQGRSVVCLARRNNLSKQDETEHRMRCIFFLYCEPCMNPKSSTEGIVQLRVVLDPLDATFNSDKCKQNVMYLFENVLPAKFHAIHFCCLPSQKATRRHFAKTVLPRFVHGLGPQQSQKAVIHLEGNAGKMAEKLRPFGLHKEGLPPSLGGEWSYEHYFSRLLGGDRKLPASTRAHSQLSAFIQADNGHKQIQAGNGLKTQPCQSQDTLSIVSGSPATVATCLDGELDQVTFCEKEAYLEARMLGVCEDPTSFIKVCGGNKRKAARRLVEYWRIRKEIFGDRAFRSLLDLSGNGALSDSDIESLESGCPGIQLPNPLCGNALLFFEHFKVDTNAALRGSMYLLARAAAETSKSGIVVLYLVRQGFDRQGFQQLVSLATCCPVEILNFHFCCLAPEDGTRDQLMENIVPWHEKLLAETFGNRTVMHVAENKTMLLEELLSCGFRKASLPTSIGGSWTFGNMKSLIGQKTASSNAESSENEKTPDTSATDDGLCVLANAAHEVRQESRKSRKRMLDAIYARERRQREKSVQKTLEQQCSDLASANSRLERENECFEKILAEAKLQISLAQHNMSISGSEPTQKGTISAHSMIAPTQSVNISALVAKSLLGTTRQCTIDESDGVDVASRSVAACSPPLFSGTESSNTSGIIGFNKQNQYFNPALQLDLALLGASTSGREIQDSHQSNDLQSLVHQIQEILRGRHPQLASTATFSNQKTSTLATSSLPLQLQNWLTSREPHRVPAEFPHHQQLPTPASQNLVNQLLFANIAQRIGQPGLPGSAAALSSSQASVHCQESPAGLTQDLLLQFLRSMPSSSTPLTQAQYPTPDLGELQDAFDKYFFRS